MPLWARSLPVFSDLRSSRDVAGSTGRKEHETLVAFCALRVERGRLEQNYAEEAETIEAADASNYALHAARGEHNFVRFVITWRMITRTRENRLASISTPSL
jgi:hypothetical protein